jgi:hypothetical protein
MAVDLRELVGRFKTGEAPTPQPSPRVEREIKPAKAPIAQRLAADRKKLEELRKKPEATKPEKPRQAGPEKKEG